ncbi:MAG: cysteine desulfurase family protein, partial [Salinisphaeraceae bacterium]|nr:cysteine desulfurase family protein [Salinisphaeraceae bacterium]
VDESVYAAMQPYFCEVFGNPSSLHRFGRSARDAINRAREQVARLIGAQPAQVLFTSGGTEANNTAIKGLLKPGERVLISAIEHPSLYEQAAVLRAHGIEVEMIPAQVNGQVDLAVLDELLEADNVRLVSVMRVNNETGVIQPTQAIAERVRAAGALYHCDTVQAAGKLPLDWAQTGADLMSLSSHKIYGPKGAGALVLDKRVDIQALLHGGGHEQGLRAGTENLAAIVGFGAAAELAAQQQSERAAHSLGLREQLEAGLAQLPGIVVFGQGVERLPNTVQFSVPGFDGEALLMALDRHGIAVSSGSACSSGKGEPSHVLINMGIDEVTARAAIRVSLGKDNNAGEVQQFLQVLNELVQGKQADMAGRFAAVMGQGA